MFNWGKKKEQAVERVEPVVAASPPAVKNEAISLSNVERLSDLLGISPTNAGVVVNPATAMKVSVVYRCVGLIAGAIASLPCTVYKRLDDGSRVKATKKQRPEVIYLNESASEMWTAATFWEFITMSMLLRSDGYALIRRNRAGDVLGLIPVDPSRIYGDSVNSRMRYDIVDDKGNILRVDQDDMLHFPGVGFDGIKSKSVISWAANNAIGNAIAMEEFAGKFFSEGALPNMVLTFPKSLTDPQIKSLREFWLERHRGNHYMPAVLTEGGKAESLSMSAEDTQLLESRKWQVVDICRAFGVPPFMIGETEKTTSWGSGVEHMSIGFVMYTLQPHLNRWEQELNRKLFRNGAFFAEFNTSGLLRGDNKARSDYYRQAIGGSHGPGWMTINEVRRLENLPPVEGGDEIYDPTKAQANPNEEDTGDEDGEAPGSPDEQSGQGPWFPRRGFD